MDTLLLVLILLNALWAPLILLLAIPALVTVALVTIVPDITIQEILRVRDTNPFQWRQLTQIRLFTRQAPHARVNAQTQTNKRVRERVVRFAELPPPRMIFRDARQQQPRHHQMDNHEVLRQERIQTRRNRQQGMREVHLTDDNPAGLRHYGEELAVREAVRDLVQDIAYVARRGEHLPQTPFPPAPPYTAVPNPVIRTEEEEERAELFVHEGMEFLMANQRAHEVAEAIIQQNEEREQDRDDEEEVRHIVRRGGPRRCEHCLSVTGHRRRCPWNLNHLTG